MDIANALHVRYEDILKAAGYLDTKPESPGIADIISSLKYLTDDELEQVQIAIDGVAFERVEMLPG